MKRNVYQWHGYVYTKFINQVLAQVIYGVIRNIVRSKDSIKYPQPRD